MIQDHDLEERHRRDGLSSSGDAGTAPGKRTLTGRLPPSSTAAEPSLLGRERAVASFDTFDGLGLGDYREGRATIETPHAGGGGDEGGGFGEYRESRATIDAPHRDPFDFLDEDREARRERERPARRRRPRRKPARAGGASAARASGAAATGEGGAAGKPRKLLGEISNRLVMDDDRPGAPRVRLVVVIGRQHGVTEDATFELCRADGRPMGAPPLVALERERLTTALLCKLPEERIPDGARVLVTIPPASEPELHPDGSIGDDDLTRLEA